MVPWSDAQLELVVSGSGSLSEVVMNDGQRVEGKLCTIT